ncbi:unnamed protein product, partial [Ectocarpus sp. 12 AP-2014]
HHHYHPPPPPPSPLVASPQQEEQLAADSLSPRSPPLPRRTSSSFGGAVVSPVPVPVPAPAAAAAANDADGNESNEEKKKPARQEVSADQAQLHRTVLSRRSDVWLPVGKCSGAGGGGGGPSGDGACHGRGGGVGASGDAEGRSFCAREGVSADQARQHRASFSRRNDFLVNDGENVPSKLARDSQGETNIKARLCTTTAASSTFSLLRPAQTSTLPFSPAPHEPHAHHRGHRPSKTTPSPPSTLGGNSSWSRVDASSSDHPTVTQEDGGIIVDSPEITPSSP